MAASRGYSLQQCMLRVANATASVAYYTTHFGMTLVDKLSFPDAKFDLYFLASMPDDGATLPAPGSQEAHDLLWRFPRSVIELTHNYDPEQYDSGNKEPHRGFGHTGFIVDDVASFCDALMAAGVPFQKRPQDGKMRHIAFALDPGAFAVSL